MKPPRAPRTRKRISCELKVGSDRYTGIVLDLSATGMFIQTTLKPESAVKVEVHLVTPGSGKRLMVPARVARANLVPVQLLAVAKGGVGLFIDRPTREYLDFVAEMSPEQAEFAAGGGAARRPSAGGRPRSGPGRAGDAAACGSAPVRKRFRVHALDSKSGKKSSYIVTSESEERAGAQVLAELGVAWQVLSVESV